jgi:glutathione S-transferase
MSHGLTGLVTALNVVLMLVTMVMVGRARGKHGVKAPAMTGPDAFERVLRVQMNTLEATVMFLPSLWLFALYLNSVWAGALGFVWLFGRLLYALGYVRAADKRGTGFLIAFLANVALLLGAFWGLLRLAL